MEFEEIRPYHDEELPQVFEELIADPAFQQVACAVMPGVPFEAIAQKMRASKTKQEFQENLCYGILHKLAKDTTDGLILESMAVLNKQSAYTMSPIIGTLFSTPVFCLFSWWSRDWTPWKSLSVTIC